MKVENASGELPPIKKWPEIDIKKITSVVSAVVQQLADYDKDDVFKAPVVETYPELAASYLETIENPMDLRTIDEERIHLYESITMLQEDLILMFRNCCTFNAPDSDLWHYGMNIYQRINQVFQDVCTELGIGLPRRWSP